eukprot:scaffold10054_cov140-Cylindrotheca_fusiformis.AAC.7
MSNPSQRIGGGAINEKKRSFDGKGNANGRTKIVSAFDPLNRSHLMHAIEGLDRYPNYLSRWSENEISLLEDSLQHQLSLVKSQKQQIQERREALRTVVDQICEKEPAWGDFLAPPVTWEDVRSNILDTRASNTIFRSRHFQVNKKNTHIPSVEDVIQGKTKIDLDAGHLETIMDEELFDVYSFPLLAPSFCCKLQCYVQRVIKEIEENSDFKWLTAGSIRDLDNLGLPWLNSLLLHLVVRPITEHLYKESEIGGGDLDWRQGYIAAYSADPTDTKPRQRLVPHTDDAEVTLNVCIGEKFDGGLLQFWGLRGTPEAGRLVGDYKPTIGRALLHSGRHLHEVTEVTSGDRFAYILWARSWNGTRATTCPCCWLNRRENDKTFCVCGPKWN